MPNLNNCACMLNDAASSKTVIKIVFFMIFKFINKGRSFERCNILIIVFVSSGCCFFVNLIFLEVVFSNSVIIVTNFVNN